MPKGATKRAKTPGIILSDTWTLEIAALVLSAVSLVLIIILLSVYDGKPQFSFGFINLNTVIAILAAAFRIGFMVPVGEALAQWKWLWFSRKSRPLGDFDSIDDASRGTRGSFLLLWETKGWSLAAIGAWIAVLSLATEPFIQQLVTFRDTVMFADSPGAQIPFARSWDGGSSSGSSPDVGTSNPTGDNLTAIIGEYGSVRDIQLDQDVQAAVQFGLNSGSAAVAAQLDKKCISGNCTFPSFVSLSVCSKCSDVSRLLKSSELVDDPMGWFAPHGSNGPQGVGPQNLTQYYLPNGLSINNRRPGESYGYGAAAMVATALSDLRPSSSLSFQKATTMLFSTTVLRIPDSSYPDDGYWLNSDPPLEATECGLYLCIKEFESRVQNGVLVENSREVSATREPESFEVVSDFCEGLPCTLDFRVSPAVDALFSNTTYFARTDLSIKTPATIQSSSKLPRVNVTQAGIDSLSSYILSIFDEGMYKNATVNVIDNIGNCSNDGSTIPCGQLKNISGMAAGPTGNPGDPRTAVTFAPAVMEKIWGTPNLTTTFENLANSITNQMRNSETDQSLTVSGQVGLVRTVLQVRWQWITLPAFLLLISTIFFLLTMIESSRSAVPLWKGSALAVLYHGLETKVRSTLEHWDLSSQMSEASEGVKVKLRRDPDDDVLLLRTDLDRTQSIPLMNTKHRRNSSVEEAEPEVDADADDDEIPLTPVHATSSRQNHPA